jgi:serine/threonine protein kinase
VWGGLFVLLALLCFLTHICAMQHTEASTALSSSESQKILNNYHILKDDLAAGTCSNVLLAQEKSGSFVVIKKIQKGAVRVQRIQSEVESGRALHHPNIVRFHQHHEDEEYDYLVFDFIPGCDLLTYLMYKRTDTISEGCARYAWRLIYLTMLAINHRNIFRAVLAAVKYSHAHGVVHLDIKMENVMISNTGQVRFTSPHRGVVVLSSLLLSTKL